MNLASEIAAEANIQTHGHPPGTTLIAIADASAFLDICDQRQLRVVGIEGFTIDDGMHRPDMERIADWSSTTDATLSVAESRRFLDEVGKPDLFLDFDVEAA